MAERAIATAVQTVGNLLAQEGLFLYGVRDQVEWVATELQRMQCFLKDADAKQEGDERVKNWVREITEVAYRAEDVIDIFMLQVERRRRQRGLVGSIKRYTLSLAYQMIARHKVGMKIASIRTKLGEISGSRATYGIANIGETGGNDPEDAIIETRRRITPDPDNKVLVGFNAHADTIVSQLLDNNNMRGRVISIVGMGGLGKTTLAKMVYNDPQINEYFSTANVSTRVWITVSQDFKLPDLIKSITSKVMGTTKNDLEKMEEDEVKEKLKDFLKTRKYLIVMDDVWTTNVWRMISEALPDVNGSRVLLTTRSEEVAKLADPMTCPYMLPLLKDDESWELFSGNVFPTSSVPHELEEVGRRMVRRCGGLPLALGVLGGILSTKPPTPLVWMRVEKSMNWDSTQEGDHCMKILSLSYKNLPHHYLRSCFLYISSFSEDSEISASELARLWIAEGFIPQKDRETMEDTAKDYLEEFVQRSMLQVVRRRHDGTVKTCRIHDLIREMCLIEAKRDKFLGTIPGGTITTSSDYCGTCLERNISSTRRLTLENPTNDDCSRSYLPSNLRSLFLRSELETNGPLRILHGLKLLRVLDLCGLENLEKFPKEIELMSHLRYLKFGPYADLSKLPSSICKLQNLQTLDIRVDKIFSALPKELGELPMLRHLFIDDGDDDDGDIRKRPPFPPFTTTTKLQTLKWVTADQLWVEESLPRLTSLRRLSIMLYGDAVAVFDSLGKLRHLDSLSIISDDDFPLGTTVTALSHSHILQKLYLEGSWAPQRSLPESSRFPPNLAQLTLCESELEDDPMPVLEKLPNLVCLEVWSAYNGTDLVCTKSGFPRLQKLTLGYMERVKDWTVEVGAFPTLNYLCIESLHNLAMFPEALPHITSLRELVVRDSPILIESVGKEWRKIQHVPTILINYPDGEMPIITRFG